MKKYILTLIFSWLTACSVVAGGQITEADMPAIRKMVAEYLNQHKPQRFSGKAKAVEYLHLLDENGRFTDIEIDHKKISYSNYKVQLNISKQLKKAFIRLRDIAWARQRKMITAKNTEERILKAVIYYGALELKRKHTRAQWPYSSFLLPRYASIIYCSLFSTMQEARKNPGTQQIAGLAEEMLRKIAFRAFTMPLRRDVSDPYNPDHYRNNGAWVGGNFSYRKPFINAAVCNDAKLLNTIWTVCNHAITLVSHNTRNDAFWQEGLCADGGVWGHGQQSYAFGYGIDGIGGLLKTLQFFRRTKLKENSLSPKQIQYLIEFADAMTWLQYRDRANLSILGRHNLTYKKSRYIIRIDRYLDNLGLLNPPLEAQQQIDTLRAELKNNGAGLKPGIRYFWNSDDLVMRGQDYYVLANMISPRSCGPESVATTSSGVNYNLADGTAMILKNGDEYDYTIGAWNFATPPGSTARNVKLPRKNIWRGFFSKHNFAGGIGGQTGVAGFIFEKYMSPKVSRYKFNELCGIKAQKAYFMYPGIIIALGAGITNQTPDINGTIVTNINQTALKNSLHYQINGKDHEAVTPYKIKVELAGIKQAVTMWQKGIGYIVFRSQGTLTVSGDKHKTKWTTINTRNKKYKNMLKEIELFNISIDHGLKPHNAHYAYMVALQTPDLKSVDALAKSNRFKIVSNNKDLQAVHDFKTKTAQMIFYNPKSIYKYNNLKVATNYTAIVRIVTLPDNKFKISVADPTQNDKLQNIILTINDKKVKVSLPQKPFCGKQADITIQL
jgi:chondroitin AC lyase